MNVLRLPDTGRDRGPPPNVCARAPRPTERGLQPPGAPGIPAPGRVDPPSRISLSQQALLRRPLPPSGPIALASGPRLPRAPPRLAGTRTPARLVGILREPTARGHRTDAGPGTDVNQGAHAPNPSILSLIGPRN